MTKFVPRYRTVDVDEESTASSLPKEAFDKFNPALLALGDIRRGGESVEALAAIFDLQGFTNFCNQNDPHLVVPEYLRDFLEWLFNAIRKSFIHSTTTDRVLLWSPLPFYSKFLGDGVLFLWDTRKLDPGEIGNIVLALKAICKSYESEFLPTVRTRVLRPPLKLRCGVARGQVVSIGKGVDFVGPCINIASRLQKLGTLTFAFPRRGFDPKECFQDDVIDEFVTKKVRIRGTNDEEIVLVDKAEFEALSEEHRKEFQDP